MKMVPLGNFATETGRKAGIDTSPVYSVTKHQGFVPSEDYFRKQVFSRDLSGYKLVEAGDFAYATIHLDEGSMGIAPRRALISPMYTAFTIDTERVSPRYLIRVLKAPRALQAYSNLGNGSAHRRRSIPFSRLSSFEVPLPDLNEQERIADILDKADALRTKRREAIAHLDSLGQSIFHETFAKAGSPEVTLAEILRMGLRNGLSPSTAGQVSGEVLTLGAITGAHLDLTQKKTALFDSVFHGEQLLCSGKLLICRGNGNKSLVGRAKVVGKIEGHIGYPDTIIAGDLDVERVDPLFVQSAWGTQQVRRQIELGATTTNGTYKVNQKLLSSIRLPLPPRDLQHEFALKTRSIERLKMRHVGQLELLDNLFNSLQDRAFKGDL